VEKIAQERMGEEVRHSAKLDRFFGLRRFVPGFVDTPATGRKPPRRLDTHNWAFLPSSQIYAYGVNVGARLTNRDKLHVCISGLDRYRGHHRGYEHCLTGLAFFQTIISSPTEDVSGVLTSTRNTYGTHNSRATWWQSEAKRQYMFEALEKNLKMMPTTEARWHLKLNLTP